jgi:NAD(P)-dependent dehydrogenase (short-subunit alcohol dehydrogenase family)
MSRPYEFPALPFEPIEAGSSVLVTGPGRLASRIGRRLALERNDDEASLVVTTNTTGRALAADAAAAYPEADTSRLGIVDATGRSATRTDTAARIRSVSSTADLTGVSIDYSILSSEFADEGIDRVRSCFDSLSLFLMYTKFQTITRFTHTLSGRVAATDGLGVFVFDPTMHDPRVEYTLGSICDGTVEVRREAGTAECRIEGLPGQPSGWSELEE